MSRESEPAKMRPGAASSPHPPKRAQGRRLTSTLSRTPKFVRDVTLTGGTQFVQGATAMLGGILVARFVGPAGKGEISVLVALGSMAVLIASLGVHTSSIYFLGRFRSDRDAIISNNYVFGALGGIATTLCLGLVVLAFRRVLLNEIGLSLFLIYLAFVPLNYFNEFARRTILGEARVGMYNLPDLVSGASLLFGAGAVLLVFGPHVAPLLAVRVATEIGIAILLIAYMHTRLRFRFVPSLRLLRSQVRYGLKNYASSLLWTILLQSDLLLCNNFLGPRPTGVYSVAVSLGLPVTLLANVVAVLVFQRSSAEDVRETRVSNMNRVMRVLTLVIVVAAVFMASTASLFVPLIYGDRFRAASDALLLLLPGLVALGLETVLMNFLAGEGSPSIVYRAPIAGVALNLAANLVVIPRFGIDGAAVTSTIGYATVLVLVLRYYMRSTGSSIFETLFARRADFRGLWQMSSHVSIHEPALALADPSQER